jgi:tRNA U38,U39,U40 pseudouridine synthase TruA
MSTAAALLPREPRDWAAFAGRVPKGRSTVRTLMRCEVRARGPHHLEVWMEADAFLPHQVRRTVGALDGVGAGRVTPSEFGGLIGAPPCSVGPAAPAQGLTLMAVCYAPGVMDWEPSGWKAQY